MKGRIARIPLAAVLFAFQAVAVSAPLPGQSAGELHLRRLLAVPLGALPPSGMLMPASRNHNYWVGRLQSGTQWDNVAGDLTGLAGGIDLQWRGGSTVGITGGYQFADCEEDAVDCNGHPLFGARGRFGIITGGPTLAALVGDNSATTTLGAEIGFGYAPNAMSGQNACAIDLGMPVSLSLFQRIRVLSFLTPGVAWDVRCPVNGTVGTAASSYLGAGIGVQQLGHPGLDISFGAQRIFRRNAGVQLGVNVTFVWLP